MTQGRRLAGGSLGCAVRACLARADEWAGVDWTKHTHLEYTRHRGWCITILRRSLAMRPAAGGRQHVGTAFGFMTAFQNCCLSFVLIAAGGLRMPLEGLPQWDWAWRA